MATGVPKCEVTTNATRIISSYFGIVEGKSEEELGGDEQPTSAMVIIGISMGLFGSVAINMGQNMQSLGMKGGEEFESKPWKSKTWLTGISIFVVGSLVNFTAFSFAPASVLVPLEAVQFITNVIFNRFVNQSAISTRMSVGVALAIFGTFVTVFFGPNDDRCFTVRDMEAFWTRPLWWIYFVTTFIIAAICYFLNVKYQQRAAAAASENNRRHHHRYLLPITFSLSAALAGGAQMIVHSKAVAELFEILILKLATPELDQPLPLITWYFWVEFGLLAVCGIFWLYKMNESLALYDPLFIIPLMQSAYILFGVVASGIYFQEFAGLSERIIFGLRLGFGCWILFLSGMFFILSGLYLIAPQQRQDDSPSLLDNGDPEVSQRS